MAIVAKRFQCFDGETDAAIQDMLNIGNGIYNSTKNEIAEISSTVNDFIGQAKQSVSGVTDLVNQAKAEAKGAIDSVDGFLNEAKSAVEDAKSMVNNAKSALTDAATSIASDITSGISSLTSDITSGISSGLSSISSAVGDTFGDLSRIGDFSKLDDVLNIDGVREVKALYGSIKDIASNGPKMIEDQVKSLLPDNVPGVSSAFSSMTNNCKNRASGGAGVGKPYDASFNCNGKDKKASGGACNSSSFNNVLNKLTGGAYNSSYTDLNKTLKGLMGLSKFGYDLNMCGVFGSLSSGIDNLSGSGASLLSRASASLAGTLSEGKNTLGLLDLAGSSAGLSPKHELPGIANSFFKGIATPMDIVEDELSNLYDRVTGAAELFDLDYASSVVGDMTSLCNIDNYSSDLGDMMGAKLMEAVPDISDLNAILEPDSFSASFLSWEDSDVKSIADTFDFDLF